MNALNLPVAVIGAGPVGLAATAHLLRRGEQPLVFEAGETVGASVLAWGHVRLFSPWGFNVDPAAAALLEETGWTAPDANVLPTGRELVEQYLVPLARHPRLAPAIRLGTRVLSVSRPGYDKLKSPGRADAPFVLHVRAADGSEDLGAARAVIDASGTWTGPNPVGGNGAPALGEAALSDRIAYGIPDVLSADRARYAGRRILVVGSGHSAFNALLDLVALAEVEPATRIWWAIRRPDALGLFGGGSNDQLAARGALGTHAREIVEREQVTLLTGVPIDRLQTTPDGIVAASGARRLPPIDEIVVATGFRPDLALARELRLDLDEIVEAPRALAPLIDPNLHSCGSVPPHGEAELRHPEPGYYVVGMKSYGRAPTFLMRTGYEQVRSVVAALVGDFAAARTVELVLPETGVCATNPAGQVVLAPELVGVGGGCCGSTPSPEPASGTAMAGTPGTSGPESATPVAAGAGGSACCGG